MTTYNWGTILNWASAQGAFRQGQWWWFLPPGLCIAAIGVALSLINFGIDEYVNPRLRSAGERARAMKKKGMNVNDTVTVVRRRDDDSGELVTTPLPPLPRLDAVPSMSGSPICSAG